MELIGQRMLDGLEARHEYTLACKSPKSQAIEHLARVEALVRKNRDAHETLAREFSPALAPRLPALCAGLDAPALQESRSPVTTPS